MKVNTSLPFYSHSSSHRKSMRKPNEDKLILQWKKSSSKDSSPSITTSIKVVSNSKRNSTGSLPSFWSTSWMSWCSAQEKRSESMQPYGNTERSAPQLNTANHSWRVKSHLHWVMTMGEEEDDWQIDLPPRFFLSMKVFTNQERFMKQERLY